MLLSALAALARAGRRPRSASGLLAATAALAGYGAINAVQDFWNEQLVKRGTVRLEDPERPLPGAEAGDAGVRSCSWRLAAWLLTREQAILRR